MNKNIKSTINQFINYIPLKLKKRVIVLIPLLSISGFLEVASLAALIPLISFLLEPNNSFILLDFFSLNELSDTDKTFLFFIIFILLIIIKGVFVFFISRFTFNTALLIKSDLQARLFKGYLNRNHSEHLTSNSANYIRNITTESHQLEGRFIMPGLTLLAEILPVLSITIFLFYLNPEGVIISAIIFFITGFLIAKLTSKYLKQYGKEQLSSDGLQIKIAKESFSALKEISLYKKENKISDIYSRYVNLSANLIGKALALGQLPKFILEVVGLLIISLIAYISFLKGATANEVLVELAVFMGAIIKLLPSANRIVMNLQSLTHAKPALENIISELESLNFNSNRVVDKKELTELELICFDNINLKYDARTEYVFNNLNLKINKNEIVGLKGESGSGKSTLINLLLGFIQVSDGQLLINNNNICDIKNAWQNKISYVPQDVVLFDDSLRNNIIFFDNNINDDEIKKVLVSLKLDSLFENLEDGLDTMVGEEGSFLSGGQKQRIGIARALIKKPEFIILDEATSALDELTENAVNKLIKELSVNTTILIIAHKDNALSICDSIYNINQKKLVKER